MRKNGERNTPKTKMTPPPPSDFFSTELLAEYSGSWSSDGDSASSDYLSSTSSSSSDVSSSDEITPNSSAFNLQSVNSARSRAGVFTREEIIEQAIESWTDYVHLCRRSLSLLRENMVEKYVHCAVAEKLSSCSDSICHESHPCDGSNSASKRNLSVDKHTVIPKQSRELRALRRLGRYSSKVCMSFDQYPLLCCPSPHDSSLVVVRRCPPYAPQKGGAGTTTVQASQLSDVCSTTWSRNGDLHVD
ncbi:unnamed protein product [Schistocephalus solidus]|uniref:DUF630 family protein n=1 Tax=Schistocephalus solidus TaxID=70667 RepID=A0A183SQD8_SCHSO|nr:unnamed protein product [Schistocephalus solidus]